jgi:hypothetical protein
MGLDFKTLSGGLQTPGIEIARSSIRKLPQCLMTDGFSFPYYAGMHNIYPGKAVFVFISYEIFNFVAYFELTSRLSCHILL